VAPDIAGDGFPSSFFLDPEVFLSHGLSIPTVELPLQTVVETAVADSLAISQVYFDWVHLWMPIISKKRWYALHISPLTRPKTDVKILTFCMRLLEWSPGRSLQDQDPRTQDYLVAKKVLYDAEARALLSLQLLQAMVLVAVYEYAHAIYPAAAVTSTVCVRYGLILGINKQRKMEIEQSIFDKEEQEERRRVWWAIFVLDQMISQQNPVCPEPRADDMLPVADHVWDAGIYNVDNLSTITSPATTNMGMLARLSQAAYLLGRVTRHKQSPTGDADFDAAERMQLDRSLRSLINLTYEEGNTRLMAICPQLAVCFSAVIMLHSSPRSYVLSPGKELSPEHQDRQAESARQGFETVGDTLNFLRPLAHESWGQLALFYRRRPWSIEKSSPLLTHWTYLTAVTFLKIGHYLERQASEIDSDGHSESRNEAIEGLEAMKNKLSLLGRHWCAADAYLGLLEARAVAQLA
jgi:hypothetical protein